MEPSSITAMTYHHLKMGLAMLTLVAWPALGWALGLVPLLWKSKGHGAVAKATVAKATVESI